MELISVIHGNGKLHKSLHCNPRIRCLDHLHCRFVWPHDVIYDVLREEGFSKVQSVPYKVDPAYAGDIDLQAYNDIHDQRVILAWK